MLRIVVRDYLAVREVKLCISGLTVVRGTSGSGKSSTFRAVYAGCRNRYSSNVVRWGSGVSTLSVRGDDEKLLSVERRASGGVRYRLGDIVYEKVGRSVPEDVDAWLGLGRVSSGSDYVDLNFWGQFDKPFLLAFSHARIGELLGGCSALQDWGDCQRGILSRQRDVRGAQTHIVRVLDADRLLRERLGSLLESGGRLRDAVRLHLGQRGFYLGRLAALKALRGLLSRRQSLAAYIGFLCVYTSKVSEVIDGYARRGCMEDVVHLSRLSGKGHRLLDGYSDCGGKISTLIDIECRREGMLGLLRELRRRGKAVAAVGSYAELERCMYKIVLEGTACVRRMSGLRQLQGLLSRRALERSSLSDVSLLLSDDVCPLCGSHIEQ